MGFLPTMAVIRFLIVCASCQYFSRVGGKPAFSTEIEALTPDAARHNDSDHDDAATADFGQQEAAGPVLTCFRGTQVNSKAALRSTCRQL